MKCKFLFNSALNCIFVLKWAKTKSLALWAEQSSYLNCLWIDPPINLYIYPSSLLFIFFYPASFFPFLNLSIKCLLYTWFDILSNFIFFLFIVVFELMVNMKDITFYLIVQIIKIFEYSVTPCWFSIPGKGFVEEGGSSGVERWFGSLFCPWHVNKINELIDVWYLGLVYSNNSLMGLLIHCSYQ